MLCGIHPWAIPQEVLIRLTHDMPLEIALKKWLPYLPESKSNDLKYDSFFRESIVPYIIL